MSEIVLKNRIKATGFESQEETPDVAEIRREIVRALGSGEPDSHDPQEVFTQGVDLVRELVRDGRLESDDAKVLIELFAVLYAHAAAYRFSLDFFKHEPVPTAVLPLSLDWLIRVPE